MPLIDHKSRAGIAEIKFVGAEQVQHLDRAAAAGFEAYILIPADLEKSKVIASQIYGARVIPVRGNYDDVNRLCTEIAGRYPWAFVNVNLRPFYAEGSKTVGFEIAEQLGWNAPDAVVVPMAGGALITKINKAFKELTFLTFSPNANFIKIFMGK